MEENKNNIRQDKNETLSVKSVANYIKNYARDCRYSFNRMLSA